MLVNPTVAARLVQEAASQTPPEWVDAISELVEPMDWPRLSPPRFQCRSAGSTSLAPPSRVAPLRRGASLSATTGGPGVWHGGYLVAAPFRKGRRAHWREMCSAQGAALAVGATLSAGLAVWVLVRGLSELGSATSARSRGFCPRQDWFRPLRDPPLGLLRLPRVEPALSLARVLGSSHHELPLCGFPVRPSVAP